MQGHPVKGLGS